MPPILDFPLRGLAQRSSPCLLGPAGFAVLDLAALSAAVSGSAHYAMLELAVRAYGEAEQETVRLGQLVTAWDAAGRPGADRLRIDAYPSGSSVPDSEGSVHAARHTTFVVRLL